MTDYLELLLEQQQDEKPEEAAAWERAKGSRYGTEAETRLPERYGRRAMGPGTEARVRDDGDERKAEERVQALDEEGRGTDVAGRWESLSRAAARGKWELKQAAERQAVDLAGQLTALARAVVRGKPERKEYGMDGVRAGVESAQGAGGYRGAWPSAGVPEVQRNLAGVLDAAFERDARRYDGPLGLF